MHETELIARHQKEMLKKEIELKKRELSVSAMFVNSRNELICDLSNRLEAINDKYNLEEIAIHTQSLHQQLRTYKNEMPFPKTESPSPSRRLAPRQRGIKKYTRSSRPFLTKIPYKQ